MGPAAPREQQDAIRKALSSGKDPGARNLQNADLGLTISAQLAQTMGGEITFEGSEAKGNAFHFKAAFRVEPDATALARSRPSVPRGLSAVVVAAGPALRCALAETLEAWKMKAAPADGARAAAILEEAAKAGRQPDLVVLDTAIPPAERLALLKEAESRPGLIPALILLHAASEGEDEAGKWSHLTRVALVRKPVKESDLLAAILEVAPVPILQVASQHCSR
jgi:CheY-like chemotaxis protein